MFTHWNLSYRQEGQEYFRNVRYAAAGAVAFSDDKNLWAMQVY